MMNKNTVTKEQIDAIFEASNVWSQTIWNKTTVVACQLPNGFVIVESSSCVDPANYDEDLGYKICADRIKNKLWELEGYALQDFLYKNTPVECCSEPAEHSNKLTFSQALEALQVGQKVKRDHWGGYWVMESWDRVDNDYICPLIVAFLKDGRFAPATAYQEDMLAEDWSIVL